MEADVDRVQTLMTKSPARRRIQQRMMQAYEQCGGLMGDSLADWVGKELNAEVVNMMEAAVESL